MAGLFVFKVPPRSVYTGLVAVLLERIPHSEALLNSHFLT